MIIYIFLREEACFDFALFRSHSYTVIAKPSCKGIA